MESSDDPCIDKDGEDQPKTDRSDEDYCDYADVSHEEVCRRFESSSGCSSSSSSIGAARQPNPHAPGSQQQGFAVKLHSMISDIEASGDSSIVSWQPHGRCVVNPHTFNELACFAAENSPISTVCSQKTNMYCCNVLRMIFQVFRGTRSPSIRRSGTSKVSY